MFRWGVTVAKQRNFFGNAWDLLKQTFNEWLQDKAPQLGAALAYYTVFSLAPLIPVLLSIVGVIFRDDPGRRLGEDHTTDELFSRSECGAGRSKYCAKSLAAGEKHNRYDHRSRAGDFRRKRRVRSASRRAEHDLGSEGEAR